MLEYRTYCRDELISIFKTDRLNYIKEKLVRDGYIFTDCGRGKSYQLTITDIELTKIFRLYCIEKLSFSPQTNFLQLKYFMYNVLTCDFFIQLQFNEMCAILESQGLFITEQTVSNYTKHLMSCDWYSNHEYIYYKFNKSKGVNEYITKEEYLSVYDAQFFDDVRSIGFYGAIHKLIVKYGALPKKRPRRVASAFYITEYNYLLDILRKELEANGKFK